ncbi:MAG: 3D-(3,5/4)-trihydroxycyclohexane-1,2-dione acylhydrolase (decyclizing) [Thermoleophilaceae bacterium]|nr:3D-(3,5/4)-trihydroxycyclohexane-1,2-dione acylhydrolase (decyclizing) [Thermoleophilaceae bacterium]
MSTVRLTTAQAIVRYLSVQYSERDGNRRRLVPGMFGIFGHGNVAAVGQALEEHGEGLTYLQARNEQSMVHTASAFAKASRRLATLACTSSIGPGATNMVTGAALATINRLPVLLLPGDIYATRRQGPVLQQLEHPLAGDVSVNDAFRPVSRFFDRISRPEQLLTALPEAMRVLTSPEEAGAVVLALPQDIQAEAYDFPERFFAERTWQVRRPVPDQASIEAVAELLAGARRPLIIAGGGVIYSEAEAELEALAESHGIPVAETFGGKGAVRRQAWWGLGGLGLEGNPACNQIAAEADVILCVGTRLTDFATASQSLFQHPDVRFAAINVCDRDAHKQGAIPVVADAREALRALDAALSARGVTPSERYRAEVSERRDRWEVERDAALHGDHEAGMTQGRLIGVMQDSAQAGDTIIAAAGGPPGDLLKVWDATGGRACHLEFGYSCMGYELPAALGVRMAQPEGEVVSFIGDGTFLMSPSEIVTAVQEGLKITLVISENHGFQVIRRLQMLRAGREFGNEFRARRGDASGDGALAGGRLEGDYLSLDLAKVAEGLGATAFRVSTPEETRDALARARELDGPVVIVAETVPHVDLPGSGAWWDVAPSEVSGDELVRKLRAEYEADRERLQRYYG